MRTPPDAGEVDAGLDGHDVAGANVPRAVAATRGASWISRPTPCPVPCDERVAPSGGVDDVAARVVDGRAVDAGAHGVPPGLLALAHDLVRRAARRVPGRRR